MKRKKNIVTHPYQRRISLARICNPCLSIAFMLLTTLSLPELKAQSYDANIDLSDFYPPFGGTGISCIFPKRINI